VFNRRSRAQGKEDQGGYNLRAQRSRADGDALCAVFQPSLVADRNLLGLYQIRRAAGHSCSTGQVWLRLGLARPAVP